MKEEYGYLRFGGTKSSKEAKWRLLREIGEEWLLKEKKKRDNIASYLGVFLVFWTKNKNKK